MVDYGGAIGRAWKYTINAKRLGLLFVMFLVVVTIAISPLLLVYRTISLGVFNLVTAIQFFVWFLVGLVIGLLIFLYAILLFTHNYANQKSISKSASFAFSNYPRFLAVVIVTGIITFIVSLVPFIGFIFAIVAGLAFFFVYQEVAFRSTFASSINNSYRLFMKNKLDTIVTLILTAVFTLVIVVVFAIPLFIVGFSAVISGMAIGAFMQALLTNLGGLVIAGLILLFGLALAILFTNSIKTDVYMQLKKKRR